MAYAQSCPPGSPATRFYLNPFDGEVHWNDSTAGYALSDEQGGFVTDFEKMNDVCQNAGTYTRSFMKTNKHTPAGFAWRSLYYQRPLGFRHRLMWYRTKTDHTHVPNSFILSLFLFFMIAELRYEHAEFLQYTRYSKIGEEMSILVTSQRSLICEQS